MKKCLVLLTLCMIGLAGCTNNAASANIPAQRDTGAQSESPPDSTLSGWPEDTPLTATHDTLDINRPDRSNAASDGSVVEIKEKMFIAQTNDIYYNAEDYIGKTIQYEGIFDVYEYAETGERYYSVIRYGPGCCGIDANAGFEVVWDQAYPNQNDWVEAVGVLEEYEYDGMIYLRLWLTSLTVLQTRGQEYVYQ